MSTDKYTVFVEPFAERHYIKSFARKYSSAWDVTLTAIIQGLERLDDLLTTSRASTIVDTGSVRICKTQFKIATSKESAKTSGNRCIIATNEETQRIRVLLVYTKTDLSGSNETAEWKKIVAEEFPEYRSIL